MKLQMGLMGALMHATPIAMVCGGSPEQNARVVRTILESELSSENLKF
jgi:hypothetical protein